jgi:oxaloacetate decarboxylase gamma subunit
MLQQLPKELLLEQLNNGLILMLLGMGFVFIFLTLLVFSTKLLSLLVGKNGQKKVPVVAKKVVVQPSSTASPSKQPEIAAAIAAAVAHSKR